MTRSLTGDWTQDLPHSKPALYHYAIEMVVLINVNLSWQVGVCQALVLRSWFSKSYKACAWRRTILVGNISREIIRGVEQGFPVVSWLAVYVFALCRVVCTILDKSLCHYLDIPILNTLGKLLWNISDGQFNELFVITYSLLTTGYFWCFCR